MRRGVLLVVLALAAIAIVPLGRSAPLHVSCSSGYVDGLVGGVHKCLHAGEFCSVAHQADYRRYGFACVAGHLQRSTSSQPASPAVGSNPAVGSTVLLGRRTRSGACVRGALPDRRCSPGAFSSGLTRQVLCAASFRTATIRHVPQSEKFAVERAYGMPARLYGRTIEIDHVVPLELGGSNDIANLFPEPGSGQFSYHAKDRLENRLHALVCSGGMSLAAARRGIAVNWVNQYRALF